MEKQRCTSMLPFYLQLRGFSLEAVPGRREQGMGESYCRCGWISTAEADGKGRRMYGVRNLDMGKNGDSITGRQVESGKA